VGYFGERPNLDGAAIKVCDRARGRGRGAARRGAATAIAIAARRGAAQ
jgi:hypothetical protein